jgi:hypothetical protein
MTVQELIDQLSRLDRDMPVVVDDFAGTGSLEEPVLSLLDGNDGKYWLAIQTPAEEKVRGELMEERFRRLDKSD